MDQVERFERAIAEFFGAPYAVATDCCTHAIELCLRLLSPANLVIPTHTYLSIPMTAMKLEIPFEWSDNAWEKWYKLGNSDVIDAATFWERNGYIPFSYMCLSFQFKKHLNLGRGGAILLSDKESALALKKMSYDGRLPNIPWMEQDVDSLGYHYYMTPETAQLGLDKIDAAIDTTPRIWSNADYPDLRSMSVFNAKL